MDVEEDEIKLEFLEDREHDEPAQALMTLHDSVQKMPKKHKSVLQEAVKEVSPIKKIRTESFDGHHDYHRNLSREQSSAMSGCHRRIKNTLKQPTARRWAYYEWFYSNIDRALLLGSNDFEICLQQIFKNLETRRLTRGQWSVIRRLMGKPRRCSPAFFAEERYLLEEKRKKIRYLHQLKGSEVTDMNHLKGLPEEIPMPMVIGTKVTAKVHNKEDGLTLFTGTVDAVDTSNNTYRICFDREGVGSRSIPDTDVASEQYEAMNLQLFIVKERPKIAGANSPDSSNVQRKNDRDEAVLSSPARLRLAEALNDEAGGTYGGFPIRFLLYMTALSKVIALKKKYVDKLKQMNSQVELQQPYGGIRKEFQKDYAFVVLELEKINKEMDTIFQGIQSFLQNDAAKIGIYDQANVVKNRCNEAANELVQQSHQILQDERVQELIVNLTSLMLQINNIAEGDSGAFELSSLDDAVREIKCNLRTSENVKLFEDKVETSIAFMKNGLQEQSMLAPFANNKRKSNHRRLTHDKKGVMESLDFSSTEEIDNDEEEEEEEEDDDEEDEEELEENDDAFMI